MTETTVGREPIQIVEIQQPLCENAYGVSPCTAVGSADQKCYNTRATCQDTANFALGDPLKLYFTKHDFLPTLEANQRVSTKDPDDWILHGGVWDDGGAWYDAAFWKDDATTTPFIVYDPVNASLPPYIIPSLVSVSTSPTRINLASSNPDAQGLGNRAVCSITFADHAHSDRVVDPYVDGRSWNPLDASRGSFWTRWLVRNKYRQNVVIIVYEGYAGQSLAEMTSRQYFLQSVSGPDDSGRMTITGKDILARIEERKAQAPVASPGELYIGINSSQTSFEVAGALVSEYAASGTLRIDDEVMTYTTVTTSTNGITFSGVTRATDGTVAAAHNAEAKVQECLRLSDITPDAAVELLLETYGKIDAAYLDTTGWADEISTHLPSYRFNGLVTQPTSVFQIVSEFQTQGLFYIWWDERDRLVKMKAIRGIDDPPATLDDTKNIIAGSVSFREKPRERTSQVWVYFNQDDYSANPNSDEAYANLVVLANLESETDELYGEPSIRKVYARFLTSGPLATNTATRIITRYVDIPTEIQFRLDAKDRTYWVGDTVFISHYLDVDQFGNRRVRQWTIVSAEEVVPGEVVHYIAEDTTLYGRIFYIMANDAIDYPGYANAPFRNCYIGDADGLLSDGETSGRIS